MGGAVGEDVETVGKSLSGFAPGSGNAKERPVFERSYSCSTLQPVVSDRRLDWQYRSAYIASRSSRRPGDTDIEHAWADEAFEDDDALVDSPDPASKSEKTDRLVGYSRTARTVIVVIYLRDELVGVNAWKANETQTRRYWEDQR